MPLTARSEKSQIKIFQCHLDNGFCEPTLQTRPPFPHRWLCRRCFTSRWWQHHTFQPSSGLVWFLTCAPAGSGTTLCASPALFAGNRSALVSLTGISAHGVRGSWQTPPLVFRLAPRSVNPTVLPGAHTAPANPLECVQLVTPPNSNTHLDPFVLSLSLCCTYPGSLSTAPRAIFQKVQRTTGMKNYRFDSAGKWFIDAGSLI